MVAVNDAADFATSYKYQGVKLVSIKPKELQGYCPFCKSDKGAKLYINRTTGLYHCKLCNEKGNFFSFLAHRVKELADWTTAADFSAIEEYRGFDSSSNYAAGLAALGIVVEHSETGDEDRWFCPAYSHGGSLSNIYEFRLCEGETKERWASCANCDNQLLSATGPIDPSKPVYICEGVWDVPAFFAWSARMGKSCNVLGVTGADTWNASWSELLQDCDVVLLYDNDDAGRRGMSRVCELIAPYVRSLRFIEWPHDKEAGWDVSNEYALVGRAHARAWKALHGWLRNYDGSIGAESGRTPVYASPLPELPALDKPRTKFAQVLEDYSVFHVDQNTKDALWIMAAVIYSVRLPGDPLWAFFVAPPGSGKTLLTSAATRSPYTISQSALSAKSLVSGFQAQDGADVSLLPRLTGRALIVKDYTEVLSMPFIDQEELFGVLRGAYDGSVVKHFGNGRVCNYQNCHFSMIAAVTDRIHASNRAALGERFLKFSMIRDFNYDPREHIRRAIRATDDFKDNLLWLQASMNSFLEHLFQGPAEPPPVDEETEEKFISLAQLVANMRAAVDRGFRGELSCRPRPEIGTRLAKQLIKLARCLAIVNGERTIKADVFRLVQAVALDTAYGWSLDIVKAIMLLPPGPSRKDLCISAKMDDATLDRRLGDLIDLEIVIREEAVDELPTGSGVGANGFARRGPKTGYSYRVADHIRELWTDAALPIYQSPKSGRKKAAPVASPEKKATKPKRKTSKR